MAATGCAGSKADIEAKLPPPQGPTHLGVSLTHPRAATYVSDAATVQGLAAAIRDVLEYRGKMATIIQVTHPFLPKWKHMVTWGSPQSVV